jgi:hypothetical protein
MRARNEARYCILSRNTEIEIIHVFFRIINFDIKFEG